MAGVSHRRQAGRTAGAADEAAGWPGTIDDMRLWLKDTERRPDPIPAKTDDRLAVAVGLIAWVVAVVVVLILMNPFAGGNPVIAWTCVAGLVLGLLGLAYTSRRHRRGLN